MNKRDDSGSKSAFFSVQCERGSGQRLERQEPMCGSFSNIFNDIFCISNPNNVKLGTALTCAHSKTLVKFEIHRTKGSRDMRLTDRHTDRHSCNL